MKLPTLQWATAIAVATTLGTFTAFAQDDTDAPPPPPPPSEQGGPGGPGGGPGGPGGRRGGPGGPGGGRMMMGGGSGAEALLGRLGERLGITPEQKTKLEGIIEESRSTGRSLNEAVRKERDELRKLTQAGSLDEGAIRAQAAKLATAEGDLALHQAKIFKKVIEVLTPEQLAEFKKGIGEGRGGDRRGGGWGRGGGDRRGGGSGGQATPPAAPANDGDN